MYFMAAVAYDALGNESDFSSEINFAVPAVVSSQETGSSDEIQETVPGAASISSVDASGGGGCFIATAAFGSYRVPEVILLRKFRDRILLTNGPGRLFVRFYYRVSPSIADFIGPYDPLKQATRLALMPLIFGIQHWLAVYTAVLVFLMGMTMVLYAEQRRIWRQVGGRR